MVAHGSESPTRKANARRHAPPCPRSHQLKKEKINVNNQN